MHTIIRWKFYLAVFNENPWPSKGYFKHVKDSSTDFLKFKRKYADQKSINISTFKGGFKVYNIKKTKC